MVWCLLLRCRLVLLELVYDLGVGWGCFLFVTMFSCSYCYELVVLFGFRWVYAVGLRFATGWFRGWLGCALL